MSKLWAPWRNKFIQHKKPKGCIFCSKPKSREDKKNLILYRGETVFALLNLYPYNNGHILITPYRHLDHVMRLTAAEYTEMFEIMKSMIKVLDKLIKPHGYNIGFNIGRAGGAGIEKHIHLHLVPRWTGDTNFMPVISGQKVISESLENMRVGVSRELKKNK